MAGIWETQNKILPGIYMNFKTNRPLAIMPGDRGIAVLPIELTVGTKGDMYIETVFTSQIKELSPEIGSAEYLPITEALKNASKVIVYNLGDATHTSEDLDSMLNKLLTIEFNTLAYMGTELDLKGKVATWVDTVRKEEGKSIQAVMVDMVSDNESIITVGNTVILNDGTTLTKEQVCAWVAGATAGAKINQSLTNFTYIGAVDVEPRLSKSQLEEAVKAGKFVFVVNSNQKVTVLYDINSLTTFTPEKAKDFCKNRLIRLIDNITIDVSTVYEASYMGKVDNNSQGRSLFRASLIEYFRELERLGAIENFIPEDVIVSVGKDKDATVVDINIQGVDSMEKMYMTVNLM